MTRAPSDPSPRVLLLCGGRSCEHEVSLASAASVIDAAAGRVRFVPRVIARDGRLLGEGASRQALERGRSDGAADDPDAAPDLLRGVADLAGDVDVIFPLLHGPNGEDGTVQGLLTVLGLPYVGAGVLGSATAMDKPTMKRVFGAEGLPQVDWLEVTETRWRRDPDGVRRSLASLPRPVFVKPANLGSSVGIGRADDARTLAEALDRAFDHDRRAIVEAAVVDAREIEVAVLDGTLHEGGTPQASPPGEIRMRPGGFYDYDTKYGDDAAELVIPAELPTELAERIRSLAVRAFEAVHAAGLARVDFFVTPAGDVLVNEINTMPGFTRHSMYPKLWQGAGLDYPDLIVRLIDLALERHGRGA